MFGKIKFFNTKNKNAVQYKQSFDASVQNSLTPEEREKRIRKAAQVTVEKYGPIIERLSKE